MNFVAGAVGSIITKLGQLLHPEYELQKGLQEQIEYLKNELECAHTALCKVGEMPPEHLDPQVRLWAGDVREASYDMEDILDTFLNHVVDGAAPDENKSMEGLLKRLKKMTKLLRKAPHDEDMHKEAAQIIGIERTRAELIAMLQSSTHGHGDAGTSSSSNPSKIVSVVGAGGLGKTTLAKAVYDELSTGYDCRAFVSVGRNPDLVQVFTSIFFRLDQKMYQAIRDVKDLGRLIDELRKFLENKRYFIVIDDVWDINSWQVLRSVLHQNNNGSRVVKTTQNLEVACGDEVYKLSPLSRGNSKKLFYIRLYGGEGKCPAHHPEEASQKILKICGGVPLVIITMASLLVGKSREDWFRVCSSPSFYRHRENKQVDDTVRILSRSYYDLPSHLKTCLLYLSVYPEGYMIEKDSLIWKWVAEGFIQEKTGGSLFQCGEEYFHQLINRSMIQLWDYDIRDAYRVHDMVLDLICGLADEENFVTILKENGGTSSRHKVRRLAHQNRILMDQSHPDSHRDMAQLRTLVAIQCDMHDWVLSPSFKLLRVLALERCKSYDNSECGRNWLEHLGKLVHLRYLGIRVRKLRELPEAIGALKLLQTLDLDDCYGDTTMQLPLSVSLLTRLLCLRCHTHIRVPDGFFQKVTSLEHLKISLHMMSFESKRQFLKQLGNLSLLRVLRVDGMGRLDQSMQADLLKSLGNLHELQHLQLYGDEINDATLEWDKAMLSEHVSYLYLGSFGFPCVPSFVNPTLLPKLFHLELCVDHLDEAAMRVLGGMPYLLYLYIDPPGRMVSHEQSMVINISANDVFFPKLRSLRLYGWMVQLATNDSNDSAIASLSIWAGGQDAKVFDSKEEDQGRSRVPPAAVVMPNLCELEFTVPVTAFYKDGHSIGDNLGLDLKCLPSLQSVKAYIDRAGALLHDVNKVKAELRRLAQLHPNNSLRLDVEGDHANRRQRLNTGDTTSGLDETENNNMKSGMTSASENDDDNNAGGEDEIKFFGSEQTDFRDQECNADDDTHDGEDNMEFGIGQPTEAMELNILERVVAGSKEPSHLDLSLLQSITENFSEQRKIGFGGCGNVYKGILRNGIVAVKRLFNNRTIKDKMFHREVKSLITVRHKNIVRLLGYCSFTEEHALISGGSTIMAEIRERLLCFEYIRNGNLENYLTDELRGLEWHTRYEIIVGICKGLLYLHKDKDIVHMDLKPANILLDDLMVPKITDFGLSRLDNNSQAVSSTRLMSPGYCAPEYFLEGKSSSKSDIYSLGVMVRELVTGSKKEHDLTKVLRKWSHRWNKSSKHTPLGYQQVTRCLELAQRCIEKDPTARPDIKYIMDELNTIDSEGGQFQEIPFLDDMLGIEPLEIHFPFELDLQMSHSIELANDTNGYIAFMTEATSHRFRIQPDKGIVPPGSKCGVKITMQAHVNALPNNHHKAEITLLSTRVDGGIASSMDITRDVFIEKEGTVVDEVNVMVVFDKPPSAEEES